MPDSCYSKGISLKFGENYTSSRELEHNFQHLWNFLIKCLFLVFQFLFFWVNDLQTSIDIQRVYGPQKLKNGN